MSISHLSRSTNSTFSCPCGEVFDSPVYEYVNVVEDPRLRYAVLAGLLNVATCPSCGRRAATVRPFVYSDVPHNLLAYVHPEADAPEEARQIILEKLRDVYMRVVDEQEAQPEEVSSKVAGASEIPPLRVIFGTDQLHELINASLSADERLGRLALSTHSRNEAERGQLLAIARKLALEMQCLVEEEDLPDEYIVWLYGSRRQIGALMRELTPRG
ncbi:MAG: CpXC domain-containing protein [Ktedonobacteraceae bacterium]